MISLTSPVRTRAHGWPAGGKLGALCLATLGLFALEDPLWHLAILCAVLGLYASGGRRFLSAGLRALRMLWPFVAIVALWHGIEGSWAAGAVITLRMLSAVALANLVTMTTALSEMIAVLRWLGAPLRRLGLATRPLEIAIALVIRMTPVLLGRAQMLGLAWRARSRRRASWRIILPFAVQVLDDADHLADALRARGGVTPDLRTDERDSPWTALV